MSFKALAYVLPERFQYKRIIKVDLFDVNYPDIFRERKVIRILWKRDLPGRVVYDIQSETFHELLLFLQESKVIKLFGKLSASVCNPLRQRSYICTGKPEILLGNMVTYSLHLLVLLSLG